MQQECFDREGQAEAVDRKAESSNNEYFLATTRPKTVSFSQIDADSSVASFPASAAAKNIILNRSSAQNIDAESDQSILDDHVNRVFVDTPPTARSPPMSSKIKSMSQSFDSVRLHHASAAGHRTLPGRSRAPAATPNSSLHFGNCFLV